MPEHLQQHLSPEDNDTAKDLYSNKHKSYAACLERSFEVKLRGDEMQQVVAGAWANGTIDEVPHQDQVFANGGLVRNGMLNQAQLLNDANLWRAHLHKEVHLDEYIGQAMIEDRAREEATAAGVDINLDKV